MSFFFIIALQITSHRPLEAERCDAHRGEEKLSNWYKMYGSKRRQSTWILVIKWLINKINKIMNIE